MVIFLNVGRLSRFYPRQESLQACLCLMLELPPEKALPLSYSRNELYVDGDIKQIPLEV